MLALVTDLIFSTKIKSTAASMGAEVKMVRSLEKLDERLAAAHDDLVIVDLNAEGVDVLEVIRHCLAAPHQPRIVTYASHVQADLITAARQAGAHEVMARSAFVEKLPALLANKA